MLPQRSLCGLLAVLILILLLLPSSDVCALPLLVADDSRGLWTVDTDTGQAIRIGSTGATLTDIALASDGRLFGISFRDLYAIDPGTGATTLIGSLGVSDANALEFGSGGVLYLATRGGQLRSVDLDTGSTTFVMSSGPSSGDLALGPDGALYMTSGIAGLDPDVLMRLDVAAGTRTALGSIGFAEVFGLVFAEPAPPVVLVANEEENGIVDGLFGLTIFGEVLRIDTGSGAGTILGVTSPALRAVGATVVPEAQTLVLLGAGLAGLAFLRRRAG